MTPPDTPREIEARPGSPGARRAPGGLGGRPEPPIKSIQRVQDALAARGFAGEIRELAQSTRSAAEAAAALGCQVDQIAKSLVFRGAESDRLVLVIASGANRVDELKVAAIVGEPIAKADAAFVRARTGFAIGGVPPVGHAPPVETLIDQALLKWGEIWAAAGSPNSIFRLTPSQLLALTGGRVASIAAPATAVR